MESEVKQEEDKIKEDKNDAKTEAKDDIEDYIKEDDAPAEIKDLKDINLEKKENKETKDPESVPKVEKNGDTSPAKVSPLKATKDSKPARTIAVEEYLVKFKNFSYLHCQWLTEQELTRGDKRINGKISRFQQKRTKSGNVLDFCEEEPFNPDYVEVDRVLDASEHTDEQTKVGLKCEPGFGFKT